MSLVKCKKCGCWFSFEDFPDHGCFASLQKDQSFIPRYFFGPEIDLEGRIYRWESEDGHNWIKKFVGTFPRILDTKPKSRKFTGDENESSGPEEFTEPKNP